MKAEKREVWISDDGKVFESMGACEAHEAEQLRKKQALAGLKVWSVSHGFDATEGRGYFATTLIVTDAEQSVLIQWCLDRFGQPLSGWYGDGYYSEWHLHATDKAADWAKEQEGKVAYSNHSKNKLAVVSQKDWTWAALPKSEFPWPRKPKALAQQEGAKG